MICRLLTAVFLLVSLIAEYAYSQNRIDSSPVLSGPYLGQAPPGKTPELFAPEILSRTMPEWAFDAVFSPCGNEFYFTRENPSSQLNEIMHMRRVDNVWTAPEAVSFNGQFDNNNLCISPDGFRLFFKSWRPLPGNDTREGTSYIWFVRRTENGWSDALPITYDGDYLPAGHPSVSNNGTLYFRFRGRDDEGNADTYMSRFVGGEYRYPESLGSTLNTEYTEGDVCVAADESFIIVTGWDRPDNGGESDLYVSFRNETGDWTELINMGAPINTQQDENNAMLTPDGKYLMFMRVSREENVPSANTYWVSAQVIEDLRPERRR